MVNRKNDDIIDILEVGITVALIDRGQLPPDTAKKIVGDYFNEIRENYGGERYMLRRGYRRYSPAMKRRIAAEFNGKNSKQLIDRYGVSKSTFYQIIRKFS